ncbi:MAG: hypothetical protein ACKOTB_02075 [Planctomycetia bacterium]
MSLPMIVSRFSPRTLSVLATMLAAAMLLAQEPVVASPGDPGEPSPGQPQAQAQPQARPATQANGAEPNSAEAAAEIPKQAIADQTARTAAELEKEFKQRVTNVRLVGNFTLDGEDPGKLRAEEYAITGAVKLGAGDLWALTSRIKYGDTDLTVPVPVRVKWAGNTPVIIVDSVQIPGLGTFSARVLLDKTRYAGTWSHDEKGGHMFGVIKRD